MSDEIQTLDQRLSRALEAAPANAIPEDFAARVMRSLPAQRKTMPAMAVSPHRIGWRVSIAALFVLIMAMLAIALLSHGKPVLIAVEWSLAAEFILLTVWMSLRPQALR